MAHDEQVYVDGWQIYSDWVDDLRYESDIIAEYYRDINFSAGLLVCENNIERFKYVWSNDKLHKEIRNIYRRDYNKILERRRLRPKKSSSESKKMRELGNESFKNADYLQACRHYTQAVKLALFPSPDRPDDCSLALALANRSAALYSLTRYRLCLADIDLALSFGYPEANLFKLFIRKVKCLHILSIWANDIEEIKNKLTKIMHDVKTKDFIKNEISNMFEFLENSHPEAMPKDELDIEDESSIRILNSSKSLPMAADCVEMSHDSAKGRFLMLNKDVGFARLLVVEEPFVCNLAPSKRRDYCYHCFARLYQCGLSCETCTQIFYCSKECLKANKNLHSNECDSFLDFQPMLGVAYLVAHIIFKIDFNSSSFSISNKKTAVNKSLEDVLNIPASEWPDLVYKNDYASVLSLQDHSSDYDFDEMLGYAITAVYFAIALKDQFPTKFPADEQSQLVLGSLILKHLFQLQTNLISVLDQNIQSLTFVGTSLSGMKEKPIGIAIYPTVSLFNHSCSPNILSMFYKNKFYARAARSLECGTEINYCYGPSVTRMSKRDRRTALLDQYFFHCDCHSCEKNIENECLALVCPFCLGPVIYNRDLTHMCSKCHREDHVDVTKTLRKVDEVKLQFEQLCNSDCEDIQKLEKLESELADLVYWKNPLFVQIKSKLIECAQAVGNHKSALKYCEQELNLSNRTYGENSLESILTKLKYINLDWHGLSERLDEASSDQLKESLLEELKKLLSTVQSTRGKLKDLLNSTNLIGAEASFDKELKYLTETYNNISRRMASIERSVEENESSQSLVLGHHT